MSSIQPLRIQKGTPSSSPKKMNGAPLSRPLAELSPMERRRNSPSYNQISKVSMPIPPPKSVFDPVPASQKALFNNDSSPFDSSPFASNSPHQYWQSRDPASATGFSMENRNPFGGRDASPFPSKRSSIENLKRASRVKNSNMFAREQKQVYDPTSTPVIERPLASGRPLNVQAHTNALGIKGTDSIHQDTSNEGTKLPVCSLLKSPAKIQDVSEPQKSPTRGQISPNKSSLSKSSRYAQTFDPESGMWSEDDESFADRQLPAGKSLHRHAKSVTFDAAPPQVNEYEMTTPDPSSVASGSRDGSYDTEEGEEDESIDRASVDRDDSFDASLEDTDKTPVVLPEDWRFMSPATAHDELTANLEDPFEGEKSSPPPTTIPAASYVRSSPTRTDSVNSNGERRPLPPLPPLDMPMFSRGRSDSNSSLMATAERINSSQRFLPSPPRPASISKSDLQGMGASTMAIEERLRLMMIQEAEKPRDPAEEQRERRLRRAGAHDRSPELDDNRTSGIKIHEDEMEAENDDVADLGDHHLPPRISRESILRKVKSQPKLRQEEDYDYSSPAVTPSPERRETCELDPDMPLPSLEGPSAFMEIEESLYIKQEEDAESEIDVYAIPEMYRHNIEMEFSNETSTSYDSFGIPSSAGLPQKEDDDESHYSTDSNEQHQPPVGALSNSTTEDEGPATPRPESLQRPEMQADDDNSANKRMSLLQFASMLGQDDFGLSFQTYMTPSPPLANEPGKPESNSLPAGGPLFVERPATPQQQLDSATFTGYGNEEEEEQRTPDSVIRHPIVDPPRPESPAIPEPAATIKAPGASLKTRASLAPADARAMAETRRQVSGEHPAVPSIPDRHQLRPYFQETDVISTTSLEDTGSERNPVKHSKRKSSLVQLEVPVEVLDEGLSIGLDKEFDRVIEAQKVAFSTLFSTSEDFPSSVNSTDHLRRQDITLFRQNFANISTRPQKGYLMRQNTKMVVASSASNDSSSDATLLQDTHARGTRSAGNSPRKPSHTQTWTTEPWNGKVRRKSIRQSAGSPQKRPVNGPAPPMPGQQSNVTSGLGSVAENENALEPNELEDGDERGRLFVKVVGVKELDLPLPRGERSYFALTLDNGLHCVTTAWLELGKFAPVGQEFELVVLNDLEFQLTLQTKLEEPKQQAPPPSPTKSVKTPKPSTFSRVFASPRKRKELELKQQEEVQKAARQRQIDAQAIRRPTEPSAWDLLHNLVAKDGSFARSYVCLKDHEKRAYGRPFTVDVPCFNEWAMEEIRTISSTRSGRGATMQRKAPYKIGKLELQLLFVPKPKGAQEEDMPKSMNACIRELQEAETSTEKVWEGHLSQQGGDCPYWRRRFFRLENSKLTAYHESTRQPRATINLAKASKLIDDKSSLTQKEVSGKGGSRRRSAFAAEEEGYMFVEEGFRIRFANGETIDFYADSAAEKESWMKVLSEVVGKEANTTKRWTDLVLAQDKVMKQRAIRTEQGQGARRRSHSRGNGAQMQGARQASQDKRPGSAGGPPAPVQKDARYSYGNGEQRRAKTKSMIF